MRRWPQLVTPSGWGGRGSCRAVARHRRVPISHHPFPAGPRLLLRLLTPDFWLLFSKNNSNHATLSEIDNRCNKIQMPHPAHLLSGRLTCFPPQPRRWRIVESRRRRPSPGGKSLSSVRHRQSTPSAIAGRDACSVSRHPLSRHSAPAYRPRRPENRRGDRVCCRRVNLNGGSDCNWNGASVGRS